MGAVSLGAGILTLFPAVLDPTLLPAGALLLGAAFLLSLGVMVIIFGVSRPDPEVTTIGGWFGSREENLLRRDRSGPLPPPDRRYLPSPRQSVNCVACYTIIPAQVLQCPRCARARRCESCGRRLFELAGAVRCAPCVKDEVYCSCPQLPAPARTSPGRRGVPG
ncbi:MAG: hypothetical protein L3J72_03790 [Thermoplasmata archaeon]|nr:hypothetical protein [Thermoplasmata archaeon]MCI4341083.1 hypothetical protein [Thermoplasmata archaeon]